MNTTKIRATATGEKIDVKASLEGLLNVTDFSEEAKHRWRRDLGNERTMSPKIKRSAADLHTCLAKRFYSMNEVIGSDDAVVKELLREDQDKSRDHDDHKLAYLLSKGTDGFTVLHILLDQENYLEKDEKLDFDKIKPLIRLLLRIHPTLPKIGNSSQHTPLFEVIASQTLTKEVKEKIIDFFFEDSEIIRSQVGNLVLSSTLDSLATMTTPDEDEDDDEGIGCHGIHKAIEREVTIKPDVLKRLNDTSVPATKSYKEKKKCLWQRDTSGRTCLHVALTLPFAPTKFDWARKIADLQPELLKERSEGLTPLQHLIEQRERWVKKGSESEGLNRRKNKTSKSENEVSAIEQKRELDSELDNLEIYLKRLCLTKTTFNSATLKDIMYKKENAREISLGFQKGDVVSWRSLNRLGKHYSLDKMLNCVYIPKVTVKWNDDESLHLRDKLEPTRCEGQTDFFMIFEWLRQAGVKRILQVIVDDSTKPEDEDPRPHSDDAIFHCLVPFEIEVWDWKRLDISSDLIRRIGENHISEVHLYCSGLDAVLRHWSDRNGLARLSKLRKVYYEMHQGLESRKTIETYCTNFEEQLKASFREVNGTDPDGKDLIEVERTRIVPAKKKQDIEESAISRVKTAEDDGFEEQDWLKCMDEFANIVEGLDINKGEVKVALIDDGIRSNYDDLDDNIEQGMTFMSSSQNSVLRFAQNYNTSIYGHGTVMAYYIRRVCPKVRLYVAKLDGRSHARGVSFSVKSAADAIDWALAKEVDIISMSWALDPESGTNDKDAVAKLRSSLEKAGKRETPMFCANPDNGLGYKENKTYPYYAHPGYVFCIGAATSNGSRWRKIDPSDKSVHFYLPGVDLGIPAQASNGEIKHQPPSKWEKYSGSSLSCALAAGLAAMILHVAKISQVTDDEWDWLRSREGMRKALERIDVTDDRWLPVRRVFAIKSLHTGNDEAKKRALKNDVMRWILGGRNVSAGKQADA